MKESEENQQFDVIKVNWQNRTDKSMFFIDNDDDPFNDEMVLFKKTNNKFELSKIRCQIPQKKESLLRAL
jgi:hypothetical protein